MKWLLGVVLLFFLMSCAQIQEPVGDWIDVPLSKNTFSNNSASYKTGKYTIPVAAHDALEYKLGLLEGDSIVYQWDVKMNDPSLLGVEFHGHTERVGSAPGTVMFYKIHNDGAGSGTLTAPFSGIHGWYLNNKSDEDIVVDLTVSGFYSEVAN